MANEAKEAKEFGSRLLLGCHMHQNTTEIQTPEDFRKKSPTGTVSAFLKNKFWNNYLASLNSWFCYYICYMHDIMGYICEVVLYVYDP